MASESLQNYPEITQSEIVKVPYWHTIERFQYLTKLECPLTKIDIIFLIFSEIMPHELAEFWEGYSQISKKDMYINSENLKKLMTYVAIKAKKSKIMIDLDIIQEFMPFGLKFTNKAYYITLLKSAFEYIESLTDSKIDELVNK